MSRVANTVWFQATADDAVWYISGNKPLACDVAGLNTISNWSQSSDQNTIIDDALVPALRVNAKLLRVLYAQHVAKRILRLWLVPPPSTKIPAGALVFPPSATLDIRDQVYTILKRIEEPRKPSCGGNRPATQTDLDTFEIYHDAQLAERHPGWPALSFIRQFDPLASARLLSLIGDPRWYVDPMKPNAQHRLRDAFGLGEQGIKTMEAIIAGKDPGHRRHAVWAKHVVDTWYSATRRQQALDTGASNTFPWSIYFKAAAGENSKPADGLLTACRVVLRTVCAVWLDNLTPPREYAAPSVVGSSVAAVPRLKKASCYNPQLFVPKYCFSSDEVPEWQRHISEWRSSYSTW